MRKTTLFCQFLAAAFFISIGAYAQNGKLSAIEILKKASEKSLNESYYSYNTKYTMFNDYTTNDVKESYSGFVLRKNGVLYYKIKNTEFVNFNNYSIKISKDEQAVLIAAESKKQSFPMDISQYLKGFDVKLSGNDKNFYICEIAPSTVTQMMFSKIVFYINKKDYTIAKQQLYFLNPVKNKNKTSKPRLEVLITPRPRNSKTDDFLTDQKNYFTGTGETLKVTSRFSGYKLFKA